MYWLAYISPISVQGFHLFTFYQQLVFDRHSKRWEVIAHCGFPWHFFAVSDVECYKKNSYWLSLCFLGNVDIENVLGGCFHFLVCFGHQLLSRCMAYCSLSLSVGKWVWWCLPLVCAARNTGVSSKHHGECQAGPESWVRAGTVTTASIFCALNRGECCAFKLLSSLCLLHKAQEIEKCRKKYMILPSRDGLVIFISNLAALVIFSLHTCR